MASSQDPTGRWMPIPPHPLYLGWRLVRCRCQCGRKFKNVELYREHWVKAGHGQADDET